MSTTEIVLDAAKVLAPLATGVGGALATLWRASRNIVNRLSALEQESKNVKNTVKSVSARLTEAERHFDEFEQNIQALQLGFERLQSSLGRLAEDVRHIQSAYMQQNAMGSYVSQSAYAKQLERMASLERRVSELDDALSRQDVTLINFAREQNEQWQGINRSLGHLEGYIKGRVSIHGE